MEYNFKVNLGGMIDILANHLYSSPKVFVRELLQNGVDAINARIKEEPGFTGGKISIYIEQEKTVHFCDDGISLTEEEIHKFLAVIGQSSKRDLTTGRIYEDYIGRFGIGLLSCFMVTDEIVIRTRSAKTPDIATEWVGKPDGTYVIKDISGNKDIAVGTEVIINAKLGSGKYFLESEITELVRYYGLPLPFPVVLMKGSKEFIINGLNEANSKNRSDIMELGRKLFNEDFIDYIPLESKTGLFSGVAYILPYSVSSSSEQSHRIYLKNMLLTEDGSRILPKWAFFVKCFLNSSALRPTASRENFYEDKNLFKARKEIANCISQYLTNVAKRNSSLLEDIISIHSLAIKSVAVENDELFKIFIPHLNFVTTLGEMTGKSIMENNEEIYYINNVARFEQLAPVFKSQMRVLINSGYVYDNDLLNKLADKYKAINLKRLNDMHISEILSNINSDEEEDAEYFIEIANNVLEEHDCSVEIKRFYPSSLPVFFLLNESAKILRDIKKQMNDSSEIFSGMFGAFADEIEEDTTAILYFNINNPLVKSIIDTDDPEKIRIITEMLYVQALLAGHFPLKSEELDLLNNGILKLLMGEY